MKSHFITFTLGHTSVITTTENLLLLLVLATILLFLCAAAMGWLWDYHPNLKLVRIMYSDLLDKHHQLEKKYNATIREVEFTGQKNELLGKKLSEAQTALGGEYTRGFNEGKRATVQECRQTLIAFMRAQADQLERAALEASPEVQALT